MDAQEILKRYANGERNFSRVSLIQVCLTQANLTGTYLIGAELSGAELNKANLSEARLNYLEKADFRGAIMPDGTIHA